MKNNRNTCLFLFFFVSGFCSLLYQTVWLRLALASFGVVTPVVSVVMSVFMLGLGLGSFLGGRFINVLRQKTRLSAMFFYGISELIIGLGALIVPHAFKFGENYLLNAGEASSAQFMFGSALVIVLSIFPWTTAMGATTPLVMAFTREFADKKDTRSFSLLYLANVAGAITGTIVAVCALIELFGLRETLVVGAILNFAIAAAAIYWAYTRRKEIPILETDTLEDSEAKRDVYIKLILFSTGLASMAMELLWIRSFTEVLGNLVYSFALLLTTYLISTFVGSWTYRRDCARNVSPSKEILVLLTAITAIFPIFAGDPNIQEALNVVHIPLGYVALMSIAPFSILLGYLTPYLVDESSQGIPKRAGDAYAINVLGCIAGPLLAAYVLLPNLGSRISLVLCALPLLALAICSPNKIKTPRLLGFTSVCLLLMAVATFYSRSCEEGANLQGPIVLRRDNVATVISFGSGMDQRLRVNGLSMTYKTTITKFMAHLPLAFLGHQPKSALNICFGMGTTFRALLSWNIKTTAVELVPSVKDAFPYYFADAKDALANKNGKIITDDGRRYLARCTDKYDIVTIDPPPPVYATGSSLLYSEDFYALMKQRLNPGGILQQWLPPENQSMDNGPILSAVARSLVNSFPHVRVFQSIEGWGYHFLASNEPIQTLSAEQLAAKLPEKAKSDLLEWINHDQSTKETTLVNAIQSVLGRERDINSLLSPNKSIKINDDHPFNEYFWWRQHFSKEGI